jgi:hypothetical protein
VVDGAADRTEAAGRETRSGEAVFPVTGGSDFPGRRTTDDLHAGKRKPHFLGQHFQVVLVGAKEKGVALSEPLKKAKSAHLTTRNSVRDRPFTGTTSPLAYCAT